MRYPTTITRDGKFFLVQFPDIPEAITQGETLDEPRTAARAALETALDFYFEDGREVPPPSPVKRAGESVELPASLSAKVLLLNEMVRQKVRPAELARRLHTTPQEVTRLTNLRHASKIDGIDFAMRALGKAIRVNVVSLSPTDWTAPAAKRIAPAAQRFRKAASAGTAKRSATRLPATPTKRNTRIPGHSVSPESCP